MNASNESEEVKSLFEELLRFTLTEELLIQKH